MSKSQQKTDACDSCEQSAWHHDGSPSAMQEPAGKAVDAAAGEQQDVFSSAIQASKASVNRGLAVDVVPLCWDDVCGMHVRHRCCEPCLSAYRGAAELISL